MTEKYDPDAEKAYTDEKQIGETIDLVEEEEPENSKVEAVRLAIPLTDDPSMPVITFRFWVLSFIFSAIGAVIMQYYYFRATTGTYSIYFVNLVSYGLGVLMARYLPTRSVTIGSYSLSLNPGPFNIKEHALIGIAVSTAANSAYAIDILAATDLMLHYRIGAAGSLILILTTQCLGYGMAGSLRKYLVYPAEMVWWSNLVQIVFYNALHGTEKFGKQKMVRGWSYMQFFWIVAGITFVYEFLPQFLGPLFLYFDWVCWINPFNRDVWALFGSLEGGGALSFSFDWTAIGGSTLYYPFYSQMAYYGGVIFNYWIILPILWLTNSMSIRDFPLVLTSHLFHKDGTPFNVVPVLNPDYSLNETLYEEGEPAVMTPMYALAFMVGFIGLAACVSHIICFHGRDLIKTWRSVANDKDTDIHVKMMSIYPEVPQIWYAIFYIIMLALSIFVCEEYKLQLPWWGVILAAAIGWIMSLPICAMQAITGFSPGLNIITELICGYMLPGKPLANMTFKCYGYMAMYQCQNFLQDLKLGVYMKIPPRSMFIAQFWGTVVGGILNYYTMLVIIDVHRAYLDGTDQDPNGLWTGVSTQIYWGSALIYGALGPRRMFSSDGPYGFVFWGFLIGFILPVIQWGLSKKYPSVQWEKFNVTVITIGMSAYVGGYVNGVLFSVICVFIFGFYLFRYRKAWWTKYTFILAVALDTGAAFTGLILFLFFSGGISPSIQVAAPSWWANYVTPDGDNGPYLDVDRCGASGNWTSGLSGYGISS
ncbi:hypothetical protein BGZ80_010275 [Entomortierella chlamydospora]|uniref:OPT superfamily oligopeptide transporter n=1 Tax=Entomortierella chlamydospora TaxID=101097 RepID=A0A9P6N6P7_9FUNG|nr:hypothetical protein BGZ79_006603 [Entomortierella chlamydospora]KAG0024696.1 hypothetical protein BGZ80_010275 [Entomortierella chlamydospora]